MKFIDKLLKSKKTVFTYSDIQLLLGFKSKDSIKSFFQRGVKQGIFVNIYKGIYAFENYNIYELANKLKTPSYISFETVLKKEGVIFQDYGNTIFLASNNTLTKKVDDFKFRFLKLKDEILLNPVGIINKGNYLIASKERAICDRIYLSKNYYFDNLENIDKEKILEIAQIYNKRVVLEIKKLINA